MFLGFFYSPSAAMKVASDKTWISIYSVRQVNQIIPRLEKIEAGYLLWLISFLPRLHKAEIAAKNCHA